MDAMCNVDTALAAVEHPIICPGDFYSTPEECTRGLVLSGDQFTLSDTSSPKSQSTCSYTPAAAGYQVQEEAHTNEPCTPPSSGDIQLDVNTVLVRKWSGIQLLDLLKESLQNVGGISDVKVNERKFSVKAKVTTAADSGGASCVLKAFIYSCNLHDALVEFQRRDGDTLVFNRIYREIAGTLGRCSSVNVQSVVMVRPCGALACGTLRAHTRQILCREGSHIVASCNTLSTKPSS